MACYKVIELMITGIILSALICCSGADHAEISFEKVGTQDI